MNKDRIIEQAKTMLTEKRLKHTIGVNETAVKLAKLYGEDIDKVEIASYCHDIFRGKSKEEINELVERYRLPDKYLNNPNLAHGKIACSYMQNEMGICDPDILNAVSFHTTGRRNMTLLEKIVFIADAIEPGRNYPGVSELRNLVLSDLNEACLMSLKNTVKHLEDSGHPLWKIDKDTLDAIDYFENEKQINE